MSSINRNDNISAPDYLGYEYLRKLQLARLQNIVTHAYNNVPLFKERLEERKLTPEHLNSLADLKNFPFMMKKDLRDTYPYGLFAEPMNKIVRLHASSGTTGKPIVVAYTQEDLKLWQQVMTRSYAAAGLTGYDIIQICYGYGLFTGGLGAHYGAEGLGATVVPASTGNTKRQVMLMRDFGVTAICCTPSYFLHLIEEGLAMGIDIKELPLRIGVFGAEPWTQGMRERIEKGGNIEAFDIYGLSEITGPGVAVECKCHDGLHIFEDCFYPEIINPDTGEVLPDGEEGELVLTTLCKYAMPMIRYRTRDITRIISEPCKCGRTLRRIGRISSRSDDMFIIRGVNVFPSQIESAILTVPGTSANYHITLTTENDADCIEVTVELTPELFSDKISELEKIKKTISLAIESVIGLRINLKLAAPGSIPRSDGKTKRITDLRIRQ